MGVGHGGPEGVAPGGAQNYGEVWEGFLEGVSPGSGEVFPKVKTAGARTQCRRETHVASRGPGGGACLVPQRKDGGLHLEVHCRPR